MHKTAEFYTLNGYNDNLLVLNTTISEGEILQQIQNIEKLDKFFSNIPKADSLSNTKRLVYRDTTMYKSIELKIDAPKLNQEIKRENRKKGRKITEKMLERIRRMV